MAAADDWESFFAKASALPASAPGSAPDKGRFCLSMSEGPLEFGDRMIFNRDREA